MLPRIQHVSIPIFPSEAANQKARHFYGTILGLPEIPPPQSLAHLDLIWYQLGNTELHLFRQDEIDDALGQHLCIQVEDVDAMRAQLNAAQIPIAETDPIPGRPRFFCRDPFGNRIEFSTIL